MAKKKKQKLWERELVSSLEARSPEGSSLRAAHRRRGKIWKLIFSEALCACTFEPSLSIQLSYTVWRFWPRVRSIKMGQPQLSTTKFISINLFFQSFQLQKNFRELSTFHSEETRGKRSPDPGSSRPAAGWKRVGWRVFHGRSFERPEGQESRKKQSRNGKGGAT